MRQAVAAHTEVASLLYYIVLVRASHKFASFVACPSAGERRHRSAEGARGQLVDQDRAVDRGNPAASEVRAPLPQGRAQVVDRQRVPGANQELF